MSNNNNKNSDLDNPPLEGREALNKYSKTLTQDETQPAAQYINIVSHKLIS